MEDRWLQLRDSIGMTRATLKRYATQVRGGVAHPGTVNASDRHPCRHFIHVFATLRPPRTRSTPRWPSTSSSSPSRCLLSLYHNGCRINASLCAHHPSSVHASPLAQTSKGLIMKTFSLTEAEYSRAVRKTFAQVRRTVHTP